METSQTARKLAQETLFSQLHVVEFWMPQLARKRNCNLHCQHCYVPPGGRSRSKEIMTPLEYQALLRKVMSMPAYKGKWDVVFPGMEPLLHQNQAWLFPLCTLAKEMGARSIGMTTNGILLQGATLDRVIEAPITTINISLDGANAETHNAQRCAQVFDLTLGNMLALSRRAPEKRIITNATITQLNRGELGGMVAVARGAGADYAAFHPFESANNAKNSLALRPEEIASVIKLIMEAVERGYGSAAVEFEPSTVGAFLCAWKQGLFDEMELVTDETGFLFFRQKFGEEEFLANIMFHPHHFVRTIRIMDDGSLSSCRQMALNGWKGVGNFRQQTIEEISLLPKTIEALAQIWQEFLDQVREFPVEFEFFTRLMEGR